MEISISTSGSANGVKINGPVTFVSRPSARGVLHGKGQGVLISGESEMATYTAEGIRRITPSGVKWRGAVFLTTSINVSFDIILCWWDPGYSIYTSYNSFIIALCSSWKGTIAALSVSFRFLLMRSQKYDTPCLICM
jgi:hypothetical protein